MPLQELTLLPSDGRFYFPVPPQVGQIIFPTPLQPGHSFPFTLFWHLHIGQIIVLLPLQDLQLISHLSFCVLRFLKASGCRHRNVCVAWLQAQIKTRGKGAVLSIDTFGPS